MKWAIIENMVTVASTAGLILGLYAMGAGGWAAGGFLLLINMNTSYQVKEVGKASAPSPSDLETTIPSPDRAQNNEQERQ